MIEPVECQYPAPFNQKWVLTCSSLLISSVPSVEIDGSLGDSDGVKESGSKKRYTISYEVIYKIHFITCSFAAPTLLHFPITIILLVYAASLIFRFFTLLFYTFATAYY